MNGYTNPALIQQLLADHRQRLLRDVARSRLFRESKRLRAHQRKS